LLGVPQNAGKFLSSCTIGGFLRRAQLHEVSLNISIFLNVSGIAVMHRNNKMDKK
jgi:hypothetical protein